MTAPDPIDLDHLDKLYAAATPGKWSLDSDHDDRVIWATGEQFVANVGDWGCASEDRVSPNKAEFVAQHPQVKFVQDMDENDGRAIVALHNAWPAISAELRSLRAENNNNNNNNKEDGK